MKAIKPFHDFITRGIVKVQSPDKSRAAFLEKEAEQSYTYLLELLTKIGITNQNANNYVKHCYDIIMESIRAIMLLNGFNASGNNAHEAEVSYLRELEFSENDVQFADQIRFFRNGMTYYGTQLDKEYAEKVVTFTKKIYPSIKVK